MKVKTVNKPSLKFNADGHFKIVQFTDAHEGPDSDIRTINLMKSILDYEKPNFVVLTGDNIDGKCQTPDDVRIAINKLAEPMENRNIPWAIIFGNHDDEHKKMSKKEMMKLYMSFKNNISKFGYKPVNRIGNYTLLVQSSTNSTPAFNIYMLDSGKYAPKFIGGPAWVTCMQILWYKCTSFILKQRYKKVLPSLMFIHIPLKEFKKVWDTGLTAGERLEEECSPAINSGLFKALVNTGNVKGLFCGHDHLNNYYGTLDGITIGYSGHIGYSGYGRDDVPRGARVFLINEADPINFKTWLRTEWDKELKL